jgi:hypothetical protein
LCQLVKNVYRIVVIACRKGVCFVGFRGYCMNNCGSKKRAGGGKLLKIKFIHVLNTTFCVPALDRQEFGGVSAVEDGSITLI